MLSSPSSVPLEAGAEGLSAKRLKKSGHKTCLVQEGT